MHTATISLDLHDAKSIAIAVDGDGEVIDCSPGGQPLLACWHAKNDKLRELWVEARLSSAPAEARLACDNDLRLWVSAVPFSDGTLFIARDTTLPDKMTEALLESRSLLRDLLDNAADLSFEVDDKQIIRFVSPSEAFGEKTERWVGQRVTDVFWRGEDLPLKNPFKIKSATAFPPLPIRFEGKGRRWVKISSWPLEGDRGKRRVRGVMNDVTRQVAQERTMRAANLRLKVQSRLMSILNTAETSSELMQRAAKALQEILRAGSVCALMQYGRDLVPTAIEGEEAARIDFDLVWKELAAKRDQKLFPVTIDQQSYLLIKLSKRDQMLGAFIVARDTWVSPWSDQEIELIDAVSDNLAAAFEKATLIERLHLLSSRDELTGLLNRRALKETVDQRLAHQVHTQNSGSLIFFDLDHFKEINDTLGHRAGDDALRRVATFLEGIIRPSDVAARVGGDEFIVWLEGTTALEARGKAEKLLDAMPEIRKSVGGEALNLSVSIGICPSLPGQDLVIDQLTDLADKALYDVKRAGRRGVAIVDRSVLAPA